MGRLFCILIVCALTLYPKLYSADEQHIMSYGSSASIVVTPQMKHQPVLAAAAQWKIYASAGILLL